MCSAGDGGLGSTQHTRKPGTGGQGFAGSTPNSSCSAPPMRPKDVHHLAAEVDPRQQAALQAGRGQGERVRARLPAVTCTTRQGSTFGRGDGAPHPPYPLYPPSDLCTPSMCLLPNLSLPLHAPINTLPASSLVAEHMSAAAADRQPRQHCTSLTVFTSLCLLSRHCHREPNSTPCQPPLHCRRLLTLPASPRLV